MSKHHSSLVEVFEQYGHDATAGLAALANTDPPFWSAYVDAAAEKQYRADHRSYQRSLLRMVRRDDLTTSAGQARLFEVPQSDEEVALRRELVLDGETYQLALLAGLDGAAVLRRVAQRDLAPATTTVKRCRILLQLADHIEAETERVGRDIAVGDVLNLAERAA